MSSKRPVTPRSRFAEGSMNDRTSAAPPPHFLGPDTRCQSSASLPSFPPRSSSSASRTDPEAQLRRPRSASISEKKGLSGLWEGLREKIWGKKRPVSFDGAAVPRPEVVEEVAGGGENRPTREEMLASYQELMAAGFFQARAIQGTRQPPPGSRPSSRGGFGQAYVRPKLETIYSPRHARPEPEVDLPIQGTTPDLRADPATPDSRGKKRAHDEEEEKAEEKTVRKLRKTTRSITELHSRLRRAREESHPPVSYRSSESRGSVRARRSVSGSGPNRLTKRPVRPSSSGDNRPMISAPVTAPVRLVPGAFDAMRGLEGEGSLRIRRKPADGSLRERVDGDSRPQTPTQQGANWVCEGPDEAMPSSPPSSNWISCEGADPDVQSENWVSAERVPRAHFAPGQRRARPPPRGMPLCVVPDANRGIPSVPAIPAQFKVFEGENGVFRPEGALRP